MKNFQKLSNSFHIQPRHAQAAGLFDVYSVNPHECVRNLCSAVGADRVAHRCGHHLNGHSRFNPDAVALFPDFRRNSESCHIVKFMLFISFFPKHKKSVKPFLSSTTKALDCPNRKINRKSSRLIRELPLFILFDFENCPDFRG